MGVDPDAELVRPRGRQKAAAGDEGDIVRLSIAGDGTVVGTFKAAYRRVAQGASLASLDLLTLVETLGAFRIDGLAADADLLEAYLDVAAPDWREQAAEAAVGGVTHSNEESPYDIIGVTPETPMAAIAEAFRATMQAIQHLPNAAPQRRLIAAFKSIKTLHKDAA
jgi:hypothetical protein